ncbi:MAG: DUF554 family protein [Verrucomicrobiia bacterium]
MTGTIINGAAVLTVVLFCSFFPKKQPSFRLQQLAKATLGAFLFFIGIKLMIKIFDPGFQKGMALFFVGVVSLIVGRVVGRILRLQNYSNRAGQFATHQLERGEGGERIKFGDGLSAVAIAFCFNPIGIVGAFVEGSTSNFYILIVKSVMDAFAAADFVKSIGRLPTAFSVLPLIAWQGLVTLGSMYASKSGYFSHASVTYSVDAICALLCFIFVLPILEIKKVDLANYLPSLLIAPLIARFFL